MPELPKLNTEWHFKNKMPKNPTLDQRIARHLELIKHCRCRGHSPKLIEEIKKRKIKF